MGKEKFVEVTVRLVAFIVLVISIAKLSFRFANL